MGIKNVFSNLAKGDFKGALGSIKTPYGQGLNSIFKRVSGADTKKADQASIAAGNADAAASAEASRRLDARRRSFLSLNATGARGVQPMAPRKSGLNGTY